MFPFYNFSLASITKKHYFRFVLIFFKNTTHKPKQVLFYNFCIIVKQPNLVLLVCASLIHQFFTLLSVTAVITLWGLVCQAKMKQILRHANRDQD